MQFQGIISSWSETWKIPKQNWEVLGRMVKLEQSTSGESNINALNSFDVEERNENLEVINLHLELKLNFDPDFYFFLRYVLHLKLSSQW